MSSTATRVLTALVLIPIVIGLIGWAPGWVVASVVGLVIVLSLHEFFLIGHAAGYHGFEKWTVACSIVLIVLRFDEALHSFSPHSGLLPVYFLSEYAILLFVIGAGALMLANRGGVSAALSSFGVSAGAFLFVAYPLSFLVLLHSSAQMEKLGLLTVLVLVWAGDSVAFFVGRRWGAKPLAPSISPKKTWVGAAGNLIGSWAVVFVAYSLTFFEASNSMNKGDYVAAAQFLGLATLVSVAGQVGDLAESAFKRSAGMKDSGTLLPGHGGILDRIDALIFAAPVAWVYLIYVVR